MPEFDSLEEFMDAKYEGMEDLTLEEIFEELILDLNPFYYVDVMDSGGLIPDFSCVARKESYPSLRLVGVIDKFGVSSGTALYIEGELRFDAILSTNDSQFGDISDIVYKWADIADIVSNLDKYAIDLTL